MLKIQRGDIFCTRNPMALGRIITAIEAFWAHDGHAQYSHAGLFLDEMHSFEALWTVTSQNFYHAYRGDKVIVIRPKAERVDIFKAMSKVIGDHYGKIYPLWRLPLHIFPPLARKLNFAKHPVCSELVALYLKELGIRNFPAYGTNPDMLVDEFRKWRDYDVLFEGII